MPEFTKTEHRGEGAVRASVWFAFGVLIVFFYFFGLTIPLLGPDEPRYAQVAREMFLRGDWTTPTLGGFNWFEKPALLYWLQIVSYHLLGVNEFAARFGSALCGLGIIASMSLLGRSAVQSEGPAANERILPADLGAWLALVTASTFGIMVFARGASFDIVITFSITASIVSFFVYEQTEQKTARSYIALISFYIFIGVGLLAKGLIGAVFPFAIACLFYLFTWRLPRATFALSLVWGSVLSLGVAATWYGPMYYRHGFEFIDEFFVQHHFQRFTSNKYRHPQPFYFFLWVLPLMALPWIAFSGAVLIRFVRAALTSPQIEAAKGVTHSDTRLTEKTGRAFRLAPRKTIRAVLGTDLAALGLAWLIVPLAFFSISGSKLPGYVLPAVPPTIILSAAYLSRLAARDRAWRHAGLATALFTLLGSSLLLVFVVPGLAESDSVKTLISAADARGYALSRVAGLHTVSHNAEYYAAGRLLRDEAGRQRRFSGNDELIVAMRSEGLDTLVILVPLEYLSELTSDKRLTHEVIRDNGELAAVAVRLVS